MPKISQIERRLETIEDDASIVIDRDNGLPLRILGYDFKQDMIERIKSSTEYSYFNLAGNFICSKTKGEFYLFGKSLLESYGYDLTQDNDAHGVSVLIAIDDVINSSKAWLTHENGTPHNCIKIRYDNGVVATYNESSVASENTKIYSWIGSLANTANWLRDTDLPGYPKKVTALWNPNDTRNKISSLKMSSMISQTSEMPIVQSIASLRPSVQKVLGKNVLSFNSSNMTFDSLDLIDKWTVSLWIKPTNSNDKILGSSTSNSYISIDNIRQQIIINDSKNMSYRMNASIFDGNFYLVTLTKANNKLELYIDNTLVSYTYDVSSLLSIDSLGMSEFTGLMGAILIDNEVKSTLEVINNYYEKTKNNYI